MAHCFHIFFDYEDIQYTLSLCGNGFPDYGADYSEAYCRETE